MGWLDGKVAIVTGASRMRGIGRAIALRLAEEGADVVVTGRERSQESFSEDERKAGWKGAESVTGEVANMGRRSLALGVDVTQKAQVGDMVRRTLDEFGQLDVMVNNAGMASVTGGTPLIELDDDLWYREIDVNLTGVYLCCKAGAKAMVEAGRGGRIINISSVAGKEPSPYFGAYCATKFGVIGFSQMLALELAQHGINVNVVCPGFTDTDMADGTLTRTAQRLGIPLEQYRKDFFKETIPLARPARPPEIANLVAYLASSQADYITGQAMNVDGGLVLH